MTDISSIANVARVAGLSAYPQVTLDSYVGIPHTHPTNTLFRRAPGSLANTGTNLSKYRAVEWDDIKVTVSNGIGSYGRAIQVTCGWGDSISPPTSQATVQDLPGSRVLLFGGANDPAHESRVFPCSFEHGLFSSVIKPTLFHTDFGYPVFYSWVQHSAIGTAQGVGDIIVTTYSGTMSCLGIKQRI